MTPAPSTTSSVTGETRHTLGEITAMLHRDLPLTRVMGVQAAAWDGKTLQVKAPLEANLNHTETAFGGSISSLGILAGWALIVLTLKERGLASRVLIQKSATEFLRPIDAEMTATATLPEGAALEDFLAALKKRRKGRITVGSQVLCRKAIAARHEGTYVAMMF